MRVHYVLKMARKCVVHYCIKNTDFLYRSSIKSEYHFCVLFSKLGLLLAADGCCIEPCPAVST